MGSELALLAGTAMLVLVLLVLLFALSLQPTHKPASRVKEDLKKIKEQIALRENF